MQVWRTKRRNEYSVHMTAEELSGLAYELWAAGNVTLPILAKLHHKLTTIQGAKKGTRA
jgi:hypothetical protein